MRRRQPPSPPPAPARAEAFALLRHRWFGPLFTALFLIQCLHIVCLLGISVPFRMDLTYPEGSVVERAAAVARGEPLYTDWREWPHRFTPYAPLTYYPVGWISRLAGPDVSMRMIYILGRAQSLLALFGIGALLYLFGRRIGLSRRLAFAATGALAFWTTLLTYGISFRPDAPATFFAYLALGVVICAPPRPTALTAALGALYISFWFKPTPLGLLPVIAIWSWRGCGPARTVIGLLAFAIAGLVPVWLLDRRWDGMLLHNLVAFNAGAGFSFDYLVSFFSAPRIVSLVMLAGAAIAVRRLISPCGAPLRWIALAALATFVFALLQCLKTGADMNYFMLPYPLLNLLLFHGVVELWRDPAAGRPLIRETILWLAVIPLVAFAQVRLLSGLRSEYEIAIRNMRPREIEIATAQTPGLILSSIPYFSIAAPRPPTILDPFAYSIMVGRGRIDPEILREKIRRRDFALLLFHDASTRAAAPNFFNVIAGELAPAYARVGFFPSFECYRPNEKPAPASTADAGR